MPDREPSSIPSGTQEKSDLEWLVNVVPYFRQVRERPFVILDYDLLMAEPVMQLERIATSLDLPLTANTRAAIWAYTDEFLNPGLRHSLFTDKDLDTDSSINELTRDAYRWLCRLATDAIDPNAPELWQDWDRIESTLAMLAPVLRHSDRLEADLRQAQRSLLGPLQRALRTWHNRRQKRLVR